MVTILFIVLLLVSAQLAVAQTTIMAIGDRRTEGKGGFASYRYPLWYQLREAGYDVDFVGSKRTAESGSIPPVSRYPDYQTTFDRDHEGYSDLTSDAIAISATAGILAEAPDVAMVLFGAQDLFNSGTGGIITTSTSAEAVVFLLRQANPNVDVLLGGMHPASFGGAGQIPNLNVELEALAGQLSTPESLVLYVDHFTGFDQQSLVDPVVHVPNVAGEAEMAQRWYAALEQVLPEPTGVSDFMINPGLNDAWYNPLTDGQGFFINVFPEVEAMFVGWFTFETVDRPGMSPIADLGAPYHRWLTAIGGWSGNVATLDVFKTEGGVFDDPTTVDVSDAESYGTLSIEFHDCSTATVSYDLFAIGEAGEIPIQRIVPDNAALCEALQQ